jgi:hypothetical protein
MLRVAGLTALFVACVLIAGCGSSEENDDSGNAGETPLDPFAAATQDLSQRTGVPVEEITVVSVESTNWPDACLGLARMDEVCAQVITPGNRVVLEAGGKQYVYRTDRSTNARYEGEAP